MCSWESLRRAEEFIRIFLKNKCWKISKFDDKYNSTDLRSSLKLNNKKLKENYIKADHTQIA